MSPADGLNRIFRSRWWYKSECLYYGVMQANPETLICFKYVSLLTQTLCSSVGGVTVSMVAFHAVDPGSIPGRRTWYFLLRCICKLNTEWNGFTNPRRFLKQTKFDTHKIKFQRRESNPEPPAWKAGILTTILPLMRSNLLYIREHWRDQWFQWNRAANRYTNTNPCLWRDSNSQTLV